MFRLDLILVTLAIDQIQAAESCRVSRAQGFSFLGIRTLILLLFSLMETLAASIPGD